MGGADDEAFGLDDEECQRAVLGDGAFEVHVAVVGVFVDGIDGLALAVVFVFVGEGHGEPAVRRLVEADGGAVHEAELQQLAFGFGRYSTRDWPLQRVVGLGEEVGAPGGSFLVEGYLVELLAGEGAGGEFFGFVFAAGKGQHGKGE